MGWDGRENLFGKIIWTCKRSKRFSSLFEAIWSTQRHYMLEQVCNFLFSLTLIHPSKCSHNDDIMISPAKHENEHVRNSHEAWTKMIIIVFFAIRTIVSSQSREWNWDVKKLCVWCRHNMWHQTFFRQVKVSAQTAVKLPGKRFCAADLQTITENL